ncbi:MAG: hypothetical protein LBK83_09485 [Treponema sp.]|jgi:hypothetical protein|nr:hypothetical protein [Treponema sp.]
MKKLIILLFGLYLCAGLFAQTGDKAEDLRKPVCRIGDTGPGGGTVFFAEGGACMEMSGILKRASVNEAPVIARNYRGGGYSDWRLPVRSEMAFVYKILWAKNIDGLGDTWHWSSSKGGSLQRGGGGNKPGDDLKDAYPVRAVRNF